LLHACTAALSLGALFVPSLFPPQTVGKREHGEARHMLRLPVVKGKTERDTRTTLLFTRCYILFDSTYFTS
jgi:hypothetical protein